ncbi:MAG TPA: hypothetical protein VFE35_10305 [Candidatus Cybelea sp.]|jgi:deoxycytidine triphosphate deaminase|nr:hypothetical protein [Candidatus Cybelea sp.]
MGRVFARIAAIVRAESVKTARDREIEFLEKLPKPPKEFESLPPGVLLSDEIQRHAAAYDLIAPLHKDRLKPAAYELRVGDRCSVGGEIRSLIADRNRNVELRIEPFEVAIIQTLERVNMPRNLIARWNIRVHWAYEGLMWVGGPQVDPGYKGLLFCPLYNLSDEAVVLRRGDPIAVIDFVATTAFKPDSEPYRSKLYHSVKERTRVILEDYHPLRSALATMAREKIDVFDVRLTSIQARVDQYTGITFAAIAILVAALAAVAGGKQPGFDLWNAAFLVAVVVALFEVLSIYWLRSEAQALGETIGIAAGAKKGWGVRVSSVIAGFVATVIVTVLAVVALSRLYAQPIDQRLDTVQGQWRSSSSELRDIERRLKAVEKKIRI